MILYTIIYKKNIILKVWHLLLCSTFTQYQKIFVNWLYMALFTEEDFCYRKKISQIHDSRLNLIHVYNRLGTMHTAHKKKQCTPHRCISLHSKYKRNLPLKQCCGIVGSSDQLFVFFVTMFFCLKHDYYQKEISYMEGIL